MTTHTLNILLGLSTVGFVVVSLLYMIHLHDTKWKLLSKDIPPNYHQVLLGF